MKTFYTYFPIQHSQELVGSMKIGKMKKLGHKELYNVSKVLSRKSQKGLKPSPQTQLPLLHHFARSVPMHSKSDCQSASWFPHLDPDLWLCHSLLTL